MTLSALIRKGGLATVATATPATVATQETAIRGWLARIEETDADIIAEVLSQCRADGEARAYFLRRAAEVPRPTPEDDDQRHCVNVAPSGRCLAARRGEIIVSREIQESARPPTANSAERTPTAVMAVPHPVLCMESALSIGSNGSTPTGRMRDTDSMRENFEERAAIMETVAVANPATGLSLSDLQEAAGPSWPEVQADPILLETLARAIQTRRLRERGEVPAHYTATTTCRHCGPVPIFEGVQEQVAGCPWCFNRLRWGRIRNTPETGANAGGTRVSAESGPS